MHILEPLDGDEIGEWEIFRGDEMKQVLANCQKKWKKLNLKADFMWKVGLIPL